MSNLHYSGNIKYLWRSIILLPFLQIPRKEKVNNDYYGKNYAYIHRLKVINIIILYTNLSIDVTTLFSIILIYYFVIKYKSLPINKMPSTKPNIYTYNYVAISIHGQRIYSFIHNSLQMNQKGMF